MTDILVSLHGNRVGLDVDGNLVIDGRNALLDGAHLSAGKIWFVSSVTGSANYDGKTAQKPKATIAQALALATADQGDVIVLLPKHAETLTAAGGVTLSKAGVRVLGLGTGAQRPKLTYGTSTAATLLISAADVSINNVVFESNLSNVVTAINITAANAWLENLTFQNAGTNKDFLTPIKATGTTDNEADGLRVVGCRWKSADADALEFIEVNANLDGLVAKDNYVCSIGTASPFILCAGTKVLSNALIAYNYLQNANTSGDIFINNGGSTGQTGIVAYNVAGNLDVTGAQDFGAATGLQFFQNFTTSTSTESGALTQTADTPLS